MSTITGKDLDDVMKGEASVKQHAIFAEVFSAISSAFSSMHGYHVPKGVRSALQYIRNQVQETSTIASERDYREGLKSERSSVDAYVAGICVCGEGGMENVETRLSQMLREADVFYLIKDDGCEAGEDKERRAPPIPFRADKSGTVEALALQSVDAETQKDGLYIPAARRRIDNVVEIVPEHLRSRLHIVPVQYRAK